MLLRAFVPNPLRFSRYHLHGLVTAVCRREIPTCGKCAGEYGTEECVCFRGKSCVNCRVAHVAVDPTCPVRERHVEVVRVRVGHEGFVS